MQLTFEIFLQKRRPLETGMLARIGASPPPSPLTPPLRPAKGCQVEILRMIWSCPQCTCRVAKTHRMFYLYRSFPQKSPTIGGSFAENDVQLEANPQSDTELSAASGWRRPMGCLKLKVIFRKRATNYRALLRRNPPDDTKLHAATGWQRST